MALDPQIPLAAAQPPSFAQQAGQVYDLAGAMEKQKAVQRQNQDRQALQEAMKGGANMETSVGLADLAKRLQGTVSPETSMMLSQATQQAQEKEERIREYHSKSSKEETENTLKKMDYAYQTLAPARTAYQEVLKKDPKNIAGAKLAYEQTKASAIPQLEASGLLPKEQLENLKTMPYEQFSNNLDNNEHYQGIIKSGMEMRKGEQWIEESKAREAKDKRDPAAGGGTGVPDNITKSTLHGEEFLKQLSPGDQAQVKAVAEGRTQISDVSLRHRERISQLVNQYDPGFTSKSYAADKASAVAISKDLTAIRPYEKMLNTNADIAVELSKKAIATDSKLANKSINWLRQNIGDNPDVAEFLAQAQIVSTEATRVLNNPRLTGQLTVEAKREMNDIISGDMPVKSFERVVRRLQQDGRNRVKAMEEERAKVLKQIPKSDEGAAPADKTNTGKSTAVPRETKGQVKIATDADWEALPKGIQFIGPDGKTRTK